MKMTGIYILLAFLTLGMNIVVDLISGKTLLWSLQSFHNVFSITSFQEVCCMIVFAALPLFFTAADKIKSSKSPRN